MRFSRESVYQALLDLAVTTPGLSAASSSRDFKTWEDVAQADLPYICAQEKSELPIQRKGLPGVWTLDLDLVIYAGLAGPGQPRLLNLNTILDALEKVIPASGPGSAVVNSPLTLGGLVQHCWIGGGAIEKHGWLSDRTMGIVPIQILTTD